MYQVRRVNIGKTDQLDELARECGRLYSQTLVSFWRTVRHKGIWLKPKHLMRWYTSDKLHAHTSDACVQAFFASLKSWRERKKAGESDAKPPRKRKWYFRIEYKRSAMVRKFGLLRLSNGRGNEPLVLNWRLLRSKRQYQNKLKAKLSAKIDVKKKKGSRRRKKLIASKKRQLKKLKNQIKDVEHKQTSKLITTLHQAGVQTLVIGDVRDIRQDNDVGPTNNQKIHQWSAGSIRFKLTYKAERLGMDVALQAEHYTSRTCPGCGHVRSKVKGRVFRCPKCGWTYHRDGVGAMNIRYKYRGEFGVPHVVADMAPAVGIRHLPHTRVARTLGRENVCVGNCTEAAGL